MKAVTCYLAVAALTMLSLCTTSRADTVVFLDATEHLTFGTDSSRITVTCQDSPESCDAILAPPSSGATYQTSSFIDPIFISDQNGFISDMLQISLIPAAISGLPYETVDITFSSDSDIASNSIFGQNCHKFSNQCIVENGDVQFAATITWSDNTVDTILFQSDAGPDNPTPEPATLTLFGSGLLSMVGFARRRILRRESV